MALKYEVGVLSGRVYHFGESRVVDGLKISPDIQDSDRCNIRQVMKIQRDAMDEDCVLSITWHEVDFYSPGFAYAQSFCVVL
jgi:hypothetical protein